MKYIDLHVHSSVSDGSYSPSKVVELAKEVGLSAITLSDHDTIDGLNEAEAKAKEIGIEFIKGIELSCLHKPNNRSVHILGLFLKDLDALKPAIEKASDMVNENIPINVKEFNEKLGVNITIEEAMEVRSLHTLLIKKGYASSYPETLALCKEKGVNFKWSGLDVEETIHHIHNAGGIAIMAHPVCLNLADNELKSLITYFKSVGLDGLECFHRLHDLEKVPYYLEIAKELDLIVSGGSDFHGEYYPEENFGKGKSKDFLTPYSVLENMKKKINERK